MSDDDKKKKLAAWGSAVIDSVVPGASVEMVRKAIALNPRLKGNLKTSDLLAEVEKATGQRPLPGTAINEDTKPFTSDLLEAVTQTRERFKSEYDRLLKEEQRLQAERTGLVNRALERVIDVIIAIDPNMVSPRTLMVLEDEKQFLKEIGFDVRKIIERQRGRK